MNDLHAFQRDVLYVLAELDRPNGPLIRDTLGDYYGREISQERLYPALDELEDRKLVVEVEKNGWKRGYALTSNGREYLAGGLQRKRGTTDGILGWWDHEFASPPE